MRRVGGNDGAARTPSGGGGGGWGAASEAASEALRRPPPGPAGGAQSATTGMPPPQEVPCKRKNGGAAAAGSNSGSKGRAGTGPKQPKRRKDQAGAAAAQSQSLPTAPPPPALPPLHVVTPSRILRVLEHDRPIAGRELIAQACIDLIRGGRFHHPSIVASLHVAVMHCIEQYRRVCRADCSRGLGDRLKEVLAFQQDFHQQVAAKQMASSSSGGVGGGGGGGGGADPGSPGAAILQLFDNVFNKKSSSSSSSSSGGGGGGNSKKKTKKDKPPKARRGGPTALRSPGAWPAGLPLLPPSEQPLGPHLRAETTEELGVQDGMFSVVWVRRGALEAKCSSAFARVFMTTEELAGRVRDQQLLVPYIWGSTIIAKEDLPAFYRAIAGVLYGQPEAADSSLVARCITRTGQSVLSLVRVFGGHNFRTGLGAIVLSVMPLPKSHYLRVLRLQDHLFEDDLFHVLASANAPDEARRPGCFLHAADAEGQAFAQQQHQQHQEQHQEQHQGMQQHHQQRHQHQGMHQQHQHQHQHHGMMHQQHPQQHVVMMHQHHQHNHGGGGGGGMNGAGAAMRMGPGEAAADPHARAMAAAATAAAARAASSDGGWGLSTEQSVFSPVHAHGRGGWPPLAPQGYAQADGQQPPSPLLVSGEEAMAVEAAPVSAPPAAMGTGTGTISPGFLAHADAELEGAALLAAEDPSLLEALFDDDHDLGPTPAPAPAPAPAPFPSGPPAVSMMPPAHYGMGGQGQQQQPLVSIAELAYPRPPPQHRTTPQMQQMHHMQRLQPMQQQQQQHQHVSPPQQPMHPHPHPSPTPSPPPPQQQQQQYYHRHGGYHYPYQQAPPPHYSAGMVGGPRPPGPPTGHAWPWPFAVAGQPQQQQQQQGGAGGGGFAPHHSSKPPAPPAMGSGGNVKEKGKDREGMFVGME